MNVEQLAALTEEERSYLSSAGTTVRGLLHTIATLRALVEEKDKVLRKYAADGCCFEYAEFGTCHCVFRQDIEEAEAALALTEATMRERLEEKT